MPVPTSSRQPSGAKSCDHPTRFRASANQTLRRFSRLDPYVLIQISSPTASLIGEGNVRPVPHSGQLKIVRDRAAMPVAGYSVSQHGHDRC